MAQQYDLRSIAPEALAAVGVLGRRVGGGRASIEPPDPGRPWRWRWSPGLLDRLTADAELQANLSRSWVEAAERDPDPVRLALYGVPRTKRHVLMTRLAQARPEIGAIVIADHTLRPEPNWQWPLRVRAVTPQAAEELFGGLAQEVARGIDAHPLGEPDEDCDLLAVSDTADLDTLSTDSGLSVTGLVWCASQLPDPHQLARLAVTARHLDATGWVVADLSDTDAADWLARFVRSLSENPALDEAADHAGSWLTVVHPYEMEFHAALRDTPAGGTANPPLPNLPPAPSDAYLRGEGSGFSGPSGRLRGAARVLSQAGSRLGAAVRSARPRLSEKTAAGRKVRSAQAATAPAEDRYLQASVTDGGTGTPRRHAFRPDATNDIHIRVGPESAEWRRTTAAFPEQGLEFKGGAARLTVTFDEERDEASLHDPVKVFLPPRGASSEAVFPVEVRARERTIRCTARVFYRKRQLQRLVITGPVAASDEAVDGREIAVNTEAFDVLAAPQPQPDQAAATRSETIRIESDSELVVGVGENNRVRISELGTFRARVRELLGDSVNKDAAAVGPDAPAPLRLLLGLAQQGSALYRKLDDSGFGDLKDAVALQLVSTEAAELWPLEFVYDHGYPLDTAALCAGWRQGLETGTCACCASDGGPEHGHRTICPLGFWGLRMVIERRVERAGLDRTVVEQAPQGTRSTLRPVDSALFAASRKCRKPDLDQAVQALLASLGGTALHRAESWRHWLTVVEAEGPPLLLAVPHNTHDAGGIPVLVIGKQSELPSLLIDRRHIVSDRHDHEVGPVVMLLGCNTAQEDISWQNVAARFLEKSAPVVVGTLVPTLGRQATVMASIAGGMLAGNTRQDLSIGELVRDIRRQLLLRGCTLAMAVVAFGDARWLVGNRGAVTDTPPGGTP
ncbi:hypothetical protein ATKI12_5155 [Kitasatospora sp. Ki12]